jgi:hypothetical protein
MIFLVIFILDYKIHVLYGAGIKGAELRCQQGGTTANGEEDQEA